MEPEKDETLAPATKKLRGFARLDPEKRRSISSKGGKVAHEKGVAHRFNSESGKVAGHLGGIAPHRVRGRSSRFASQAPATEEAPRTLDAE